MRNARELLITGSVQGVGFRWTAKRLADSLGVAGWVRNNPDGSVSLALEGEDAILDEFLGRLDEAMGCYIDEMKAKNSAAGRNPGGFDIAR